MNVREPAAPLDVATCSFTEYRPGMGVPVRHTVWHPRWKLPYTLAGQARLVTPTRDMLSLPFDVYRTAYRRHLNRAGFTAIRDELAGFAPAGERVVLLCFERLHETDKATGHPKWCHRRMLAVWLEQQTGRPVPELGACPSPALQLAAPPPVGPLAAALGPDAVECALTALAQLWDTAGYDPEEGLSEGQHAVAGRLVDLHRATGGGIVVGVPDED